MSADRDLQNSYREWKRLAEAEGEAIRAGNWMLVFDCQNVLRQLQPRIVRQTEAAHREWTNLGLDSEVMENNLNAVIHSLIELESRNRSLIDARQRLAREELAKLEQASLTLRRIQRSYLPPNSARWISFS
jgi:tRNA isopentenyl-2-thiomethyl-A-37 hydroxylase MiaE